MTDLNLNELREVAEAATEGPWDFEAGGEYECGEPGCCSEYWDNRIWGEGVVLLESHMLSTEDARHIATFDPPTVLALLDRVAELEAKEARVESLRQAAEVVVLDAGDEATGPEPDPNLAELAHCVAALEGENTTGCPCCTDADVQEVTK